jgi:hypothetical protein
MLKARLLRGWLQAHLQQGLSLSVLVRERRIQVFSSIGFLFLVSTLVFVVLSITNEGAPQHIDSLFDAIAQNLENARNVGARNLWFGSGIVKSNTNVGLLSEALSATGLIGFVGMIVLVGGIIRTLFNATNSIRSVILQFLTIFLLLFLLFVSASFSSVLILILLTTLLITPTVKPFLINSKQKHRHMVLEIGSRKVSIQQIQLGVALSATVLLVTIFLITLYLQNIDTIY